MEVILLERVAKLGQMGEVVRVKDGFARNYLLPKGKALRATSENRSRFEKMKVELEDLCFKYLESDDFAALTAKLAGEFEKRNVKAVALSVDTVESHKEWIKDINEVNDVDLKFPIIADADRKISTLYDMLDYLEQLLAKYSPPKP